MLFLNDVSFTVDNNTHIVPNTDYVHDQEIKASTGIIFDSADSRSCQQQVHEMHHVVQRH